ncbi:MAG TPA: 30S ribosomal protein S6 [Phycisphaerales bacterium]|nr:30S ribosomal protein S6 [Phycisphaerales bacterium]
MKRLYEAMFLVDSSLAATEWDAVRGTIEHILTRHGGEIVSFKKWDERRLAYEIEGKSRGTYILVYFRGAADQIGAIERDVQLSERILRVLILRTDRMKAADLDKATPLEEAQAQEAAQAAQAAQARAARAERERAAAEQTAEQAAGQAEDDADESDENRSED